LGFFAFFFCLWFCHRTLSCFFFPFRDETIDFVYHLLPLPFCHLLSLPSPLLRFCCRSRPTGWGTKSFRSFRVFASRGFHVIPIVLFSVYRSLVFSYVSAVPFFLPAGGCGRVAARAFPVQSAGLSPGASPISSLCSCRAATQAVFVCSILVPSGLLDFRR